jgi:putative transposase
VTPAQRHSGQDRDILRAGHELYIKAKASKPNRWSGNTRDWIPVGAVTLNPEREAAVSSAVLEAENKKPKKQHD